MLAGLGGAASAIIWGLLLLSVLVFVHEGGHFLAARILGIRVKEFFLGMPCRFRLAKASKRYGTVYGVTPILLGGYTMVCGMEGEESPYLAQALACVMKHGRVSVAQVAREVGCTPAEAGDALMTLTDWGSIEPFEPQQDDTLPASASSEDPDAAAAEKDFFQTLARDPRLLTCYDKGHDFDASGTTQAGEPHPIDDPAAFLAHERAHTYLAHGFWGRTFVLVSGVAINILCGLLLVVLVLTLWGVTTSTNEPVLGAVVEGSPAAQAGLVAGDRMVSVNGTPTDTWEAFALQLQEAIDQGSSMDITFEHDGEQHSVTVAADPETQRIGVQAQTQQVRLGIVEALSYAANYVATTAVYISQLFQPAHFSQVIENSSSVVGISVMASQAASQGLASFAILAAAVSLSLGFMNLLPIPPLDGGKIVIEAIQAIRKKPVPLKVQSTVSMVGIALFMLLFFVLLRQDIIRFVFGG